MQRNHFPIFVYPSAAVRKALGEDVDLAAGLALRAAIKNRRSLEIAHQQVKFRRHHLAFSSRIGTEGDLILELDLGDPNLADRMVLEEDLRKAARIEPGRRKAARPAR